MAVGMNAPEKNSQDNVHGKDHGNIPDDSQEHSEDLFLEGRLRLRQPIRGYRAGTDALLLAAATQTGGRICDLGAGVGTVGLTLAVRGAGDVLLVEREPIFAACAEANIKNNTLGTRVRLLCADVFDRKAFLREPLLADQSCDGVATNPPYEQALRGRRTPSPLKHAAHAMQGGDLAQWLTTATRLLRSGGVLTLIHRADRLADVLAALPARLGGVHVLPVQAQAEEAATRIIVSAVAASRAPLVLLSPLILHGSDGRFSPQSEALHKGKAALTMRPGPQFIHLTQ
jgi:tRNA1(Val) A37 N6-methylase TrmN6